MTAIASVGSEALRLDKARQAVAALHGARDEVAARLDALTTQVAVSKGRIALKGRIDSFLEELQTEAHRRNVGSFERLLTLLVQDVLPDSSPIGLELSTERGLPSLDIFARLDGDIREDIFHDKGGAVTNVVSAGLRLIAVVKSGGRRLLVLDEPDCWIKPDRIPDFYRVFRQAADQVGIQCLVISHHSHALFGEGIDVARLENEGGKATIVSSESSHRQWSDDTPGFRAIRLTNFQQHVSSELRLSPGVTALIGPNDRGKSSLMRALAAVLYGDGREALIRHGEASCAVEIDIEDGRRLTYTRHRRRNPLNMWTLTQADGSVVEESGVRYETGGRNVPDWIAEKTGVALIDDLRIHVSNQKSPVFLLSDPPPRRASVLSVGQETSHLKEMIVVQRERTVRDQQMVRDGEREISSLHHRLAALDTAAGLDLEIDAAAAGLEALRDGIATAAVLESTIAAIERAEAALFADQERLSVMAVLPPDAERDRLVGALRASSECAEAVDRIAALDGALAEARCRLETLRGLPDTPTLRPGDEPAALAQTIKEAWTRRDLLASTLAVLGELPGDPPSLRSSDAVTAIGREIAAAHAAVEAARDRLAGVQNDIAEVEAETATLLETMGNLCPTCGQQVSDVAAFLRDVHAPEAA
jgi:energy-coupling factor transporter ATP-binding protein EcfA2